MNKEDSLDKIEEDKDKEHGDISVSDGDDEIIVPYSEVKLPLSRRISGWIVVSMFLIKGFKICGFEMSEISFSISVVCFSLLAIPMNMLKIFERFFGKGPGS